MNFSPYSRIKRSPIKRKTRRARPAKDWTGFKFPGSSPRTILKPAEYLKLRWEVFLRDDGMCQICKVPHFVAFEDGELDHKIPCGLGGSTRDDTMENTRWSCWLANLEKGSKREG